MTVLRGISLIKVKLIQLSILLLLEVEAVDLVPVGVGVRVATDHLSLEKLQVLIQ
jgi:hypothetical protein